MSAQTRTVLKGYFNTGDIPTESQFANLIDSAFNVTDDTLDQIAEGTTKKSVTTAEKNLWNSHQTAAQVNALITSGTATKKNFSEFVDNSGSTSVELMSNPYNYQSIEGGIELTIAQDSQTKENAHFCHVYFNGSGSSQNVTITGKSIDIEGGDYQETSRVIAVANGSRLVIEGSFFFDGTSNAVAANIKVITP